MVAKMFVECISASICHRLSLLGFELQAIPSRRWISSSGTPFVSGMNLKTNRRRRIIIAA
jgi:hypothetical protein